MCERYTERARRAIFLAGHEASNFVPGAIVILHDGISDPTRSIQALSHILTAGRKRGLRFVSINRRSVRESIAAETILDSGFLFKERGFYRVAVEAVSLAHKVPVTGL